MSRPRRMGPHNDEPAGTGRGGATRGCRTDGGSGRAENKGGTPDKTLSMAPPDARCVIVVDDDMSMIHALERILQLGGYMPVTFPSAEALLEKKGMAKADCLVLDVHLPGLTGFELYERLAREGTPPPVIFITAYDDEESRVQAEKAGAVAT